MGNRNPKSNTGNGKRVETYSYRSAAGEEIFQVRRLSPKKFLVLRPPEPGGNGRWINNLKGVKRVLFKLPELLLADPAAIVWVVEGEKDVERLNQCGLVATTNPCGASHGATKWRKSYSKALAGRSVVVLPDNDDVGRSHAVGVAKSLDGLARSIKIIELPVPPKGDVSDWLDEGGTIPELCRIVKTAPEWKSSGSVQNKAPRKAPQKTTPRSRKVSTPPKPANRKPAASAVPAIEAVPEPPAEPVPNGHPVGNGKPLPSAPSKPAEKLVHCNDCNFSFRLPETVFRQALTDYGCLFCPVAGHPLMVRPRAKSNLPGIRYFHCARCARRWSVTRTYLEQRLRTNQVVCCPSGHAFRVSRSQPKKTLREEIQIDD